MHVASNSSMPYRKVHTESAKKWLERLEEESVPVLVCLTFADKLYAEWMSKDSAGMHVHPPPQTIKRKISTELSVSLFVVCVCVCLGGGGGLSASAYARKPNVGEG